MAATLNIVNNEADTVLQPSLHTLEEYAQMCIDEAAGRGCEVIALQAELDKALETDDDDTGGIVDEVTNDALDMIRNTGADVVEEDDSLLIWDSGFSEPQDDDYQVSDVRDGYYVDQLGEIFADLDDAAEAIRLDMAANQCWPNIWRVNDHGNIDLCALELLA